MDGERGERRDGIGVEVWMKRVGLDNGVGMRLEGEVDKEWYR